MADLANESQPWDFFFGTREEKPFPIEVAELEGIHLGILVATLSTPKLKLS